LASAARHCDAVDGLLRGALIAASDFSPDVRFVAEDSMQSTPQFPNRARDARAAAMILTGAQGTPWWLSGVTLAHRPPACGEHDEHG